MLISREMVLQQDIGLNATLFGGGMMERGVSQLVSVNLEEATELVAEAG